VMHDASTKWGTTYFFVACAIWATSAGVAAWRRTGSGHPFRSWRDDAGRRPTGWLSGGRHRDSGSGKLLAVDDLQHRRAAMASSGKTPKLVAL